MSVSANLAPSAQTRFIDAESPLATWYWFLGVSGSVTCTGYWLNIQGERTGNSFSTTINAASGNDPLRAALDPPANAVGAVVSFTGAVYYDIHRGGKFDGDFKANYARYGQLHGSEIVPIGRVGSFLPDASSHGIPNLLTAPTGVSVANAVLKILAPSSWAADTASTNSGLDRVIEVTNCEADGTYALYVDEVVAGAARAGAVSSTNFMYEIIPGETLPIPVVAGKELVCIKGSASASGIVKVRELGYK